MGDARDWERQVVIPNLGSLVLDQAGEQMHEDFPAVRLYPQYNGRDNRKEHFGIVGTGNDIHFICPGLHDLGQRAEPPVIFIDDGEADQLMVIILARGQRRTI